jgi:soluble lytic murein transglycosylase-like protein
VKPKRFGSLRRKYATWALGGALALGGIGIPLKGRILQTNGSRKAPPRPIAEQPIEKAIAGDLQTAKQIADQVAGGVQDAVTTVAETAAKAPQKVAETVVQTPQKLAHAADQVKENFFKKEIPFGSLIYSEAKKNNLPPELVAAVVHTESKFKPTARSGAGAQGLMQLVPRTGRWLGARNLMDPVQNVMAGTKYLKYLTERFGGDQQKAIAAYNAGEGNVRRFGGVPPFRETRNYVRKVRSFQQDLGERLQGHMADVQGSGTGL